MLSISSSPSVSWPTAPPVAVAAVTAVPSVGAVQASAREGQADTGRNGQGAQGGSSPGASRAATDATSGATSPQAAPLLPRERSEDAGTSPARESEARAEQRKEDDKKAQELQLQEVLSNVWKASAAVVDVVLGREAASVAAAQEAGAASVAPLLGAPSANDQVITAEEADRLPANVIGLPVAARREQEPLMYTEQGTSSWAPLESGSLIDQRV